MNEHFRMKDLRCNANASLKGCRSVISSPSSLVSTTLGKRGEVRSTTFEAPQASVDEGRERTGGFLPQR